MSIIVPNWLCGVIYQLAVSLRPNPRNARTHSSAQIRRIAKSIRAFGFRVPILVDETGMILCGHGRWLAAKSLGMSEVPTITAVGMTETQKRAFVLADNKLAEQAGWDRGQLAIELGDLAIQLPELGLDLTVTGFDPGEIDGLFADHDDPKPDPADVVPKVEELAVSRLGDTWQLGPHRVRCGDARSETDVARLMGGQQARMTFTDPPYNVRIVGNARGRGRTPHREFAFASGEMTGSEFTEFLQQCLSRVREASCDGAIVFICIDWRHVSELHTAGGSVFDELKNIVVWDKGSGGQGSFYRSQHELIFVYKVGSAPHRNTFGLGADGRTRSNVWRYAGLNSFRAGRSDELAMHPTVKPLALVADALRDCSLKGERVMDVFLGSGTTLMAAEKTGRVCYGLEYDPKYVDVCIRRWQAYTKGEAVLAGDGRTFAEVRAETLDAARNPRPESGTPDNANPPPEGEPTARSGAATSGDLEPRIRRRVPRGSR